MFVCVFPLVLHRHIVSRVCHIVCACMRVRACMCVNRHMQLQLENGMGIIVNGHGTIMPISFHITYLRYP